MLLDVAIAGVLASEIFSLLDRCSTRYFAVDLTLLFELVVL